MRVHCCLQLPPSLSHNPCRTVIERFKRALFAPGSTSSNLKSELQKLARMSRDQIDLNLGHIDSQQLLRQLQKDQQSIANGCEWQLSSIYFFVVVLHFNDCSLHEQLYVQMCVHVYDIIKMYSFYRNNTCSYAVRSIIWVSFMYV